MFNPFFKDENLRIYFGGEFYITNSGGGAFTHCLIDTVAVNSSGFATVKTVWKAISEDQGNSYKIIENSPGKIEIPTLSLVAVHQEDGCATFVNTKTQDWYTFYPADGLSLDPSKVSGFNSANKSKQRSKCAKSAFA